ncbi:ABC transporter substrate-binding protein [Aeromicrobium sp. CF3.5]|uniref:ABC transporter substrate-binding protein n=1 Tax=Aeromicrobium sp. CF3.5 TaxID=3373078 RepID=UPI003EE43D47
MAATMLLSGCALFSGDDDERTGAPAATPDPDAPLPAVGWDPVPAEETEAGGTLRLATAALPANFNPQLAANVDGTVEQLLEPTYGSGVRLTADGGWEVDPDYARSIEVVESSPLTIQVDLNPEAVWQDGQPITAADMVAYWKAQNGSDSDFEVRSTQGWRDIAAVEPGEDEYSYTVEFDSATADWPRYVYPRLPQSVTSSPDRFNTALAERAAPSNGPFVVSDVDREAGRLMLEPNILWWGDPPRLEAIVWQSATARAQVEALGDGELDAITPPPSTDLDSIDLDDRQVRQSAGTEWTQLTMNAASGPLSEPEVRRAVALALDRRALAAATAAPSPPAVLGSFVLLPGQRGYTDQSDLIAPDPDEATRLLAEAGFDADNPLTLTLPVPETTSTVTDRAALIADQLGEVGIEVTVEPVPDEDFPDRIIALDFDLATFTQSGGVFELADAKALFHPIDSSQNFTGREDDDLARAWDTAVETLDDQARFDEIADLDEQLFADVPLVPLGVVPQAMVVADGVANYGPAQFLRPDWTAVGFL